MNKETLAGKWHELKGNVKEKWGKLTDSDIQQINGKREILLGKLESRYGYAKDKAEKEIQDFEKSCGCGTSGQARGDKMQDRPAQGKNQDRSSEDKNQAFQGGNQGKGQDRNQDRNQGSSDRNNQGNLDRNQDKNNRDTQKRK